MAYKGKKQKVENNFGKGTEVKVINGDFAGETGTIVNGNLNSDGEYEVKFGSVETGNQFIHANDLDLVEGEGFTVSVNGGKPMDFNKFKDKLKNIGNGNDEEGTRIYIIKEASLKDDLVNYTYEIVNGVGTGDTHSVKGSGIAMDELLNSFGRFNVHLAVIDDVFKHSGIEIDDVDTLHGDNLTMLYSVTGFKIKGGRENESIELIGTKFVSAVHGRIAIVSPKIPLDNLSSYKWHNELKVAADNARYEVERYKEGNCTQKEVEEEEDPKNSKQLTIGDAIEQAKAEEVNSEFANAQV